MKACIVGVGAIGGTIGFSLARAGCLVSGIARGATLAALRGKGLRFTDGGPIEALPIKATEDPRELGIQDLVVLAVKAPALAGAVRSVAPLIGPGTIVFPAMNGVPWWFFQGFGGSLEGRILSRTGARESPSREDTHHRRTVGRPDPAPEYPGRNPGKVRFHGPAYRFDPAGDMV